MVGFRRADVPGIDSIGDAGKLHTVWVISTIFPCIILEVLVFKTDADDLSFYFFPVGCGHHAEIEQIMMAIPLCPTSGGTDHLVAGRSAALGAGDLQLHLQLAPGSLQLQVALRHLDQLAGLVVLAVGRAARHVPAAEVHAALFSALRHGDTHDLAGHIAGCLRTLALRAVHIKGQLVLTAVHDGRVHLHGEVPQELLIKDTGVNAAIGPVVGQGYLQRGNDLLLRMDIFIQLHGQRDVHRDDPAQVVDVDVHALAVLGHRQGEICLGGAGLICSAGDPFHHGLALIEPQRDGHLVIVVMHHLFKVVRHIGAVRRRILLREGRRRLRRAGVRMRVAEPGGILCQQGACLLRQLPGDQRAVIAQGGFQFLQRVLHGGLIFLEARAQRPEHHSGVVVFDLLDNVRHLAQHEGFIRNAGAGRAAASAEVAGKRHVEIQEAGIADDVALIADGAYL